MKLIWLISSLSLKCIIFLRHKKLDALPDIKKVPVFKKMFVEEPDPEFVMGVLDDAQKMIDEVKRILSV